MTSTDEQRQAVIPDTAAEIEERMVIQSSAEKPIPVPEAVIIAEKFSNHGTSSASARGT